MLSSRSGARSTALRSGIAEQAVNSEAAARVKARTGMLLALAAITLVAVATCWQALVLLRASGVALTAQADVRRWATREDRAPTTAAWEQAQTDLQAALAATPEDAAVLSQLGDLYTVAVLRKGTNSAEFEAALRQAATYYQASLRLRPADSLTWASLATALYTLDEANPDFDHAWAQATRLGPHDAATQMALQELAMVDWETATPAMRAWLLKAYAESTGRERAGLEEGAKHFGLKFSAGVDGTPTLQEAPAAR